ncbi:hypothetical protein OA57_02060 [Chelonobacter oris]|uniref:Protein SirB1 N-terminal domain-containing protein n=1 Tax=Chelonobacter oris TaxID=505317 RepID=A0A0A3BBW6_9PAST|nr:tetratricopeptide repeat protein [Chelonobacter oris]KGQ71044.1 hypothetical protein OA57_02060 [Chelonobacter oris]
MVQLVELYKVIAPEPKISSIWGRLGHMVRKAHIHVDSQQHQKHQIHQLLQLVYGEWGFCCDPNQYYQADNLMVNRLLDTKNGMPLSLGALVLYLAESLNLPIFPVNFPTQLILRADVDSETAFINPWDGEYILHETLDKWIEGYIGFGLSPDESDLAVADAELLQDHVVQYMKNALIREGRSGEALRLIDWCLRKQPDNPYEIRDRGLVLASMQCIHAALADFDYFVEQCPDDPSADLLRDQLTGAMVQEYSIH